MQINKRCCALGPSCFERVRPSGWPPSTPLSPQLMIFPPWGSAQSPHYRSYSLNQPTTPALQPIPLTHTHTHTPFPFLCAAPRVAGSLRGK